MRLLASLLSTLLVVLCPLGVASATHIDVDRYIKNLIPWAQEGNVSSQDFLAHLYADHKLDYKNAFFWYGVELKAPNCRGITLDHVFKCDAARSQERSASHLTAEEIALLQRRIQEWKPVYGPLIAHPQRILDEKGTGSLLGTLTGHP